MDLPPGEIEALAPCGRPEPAFERAGGGASVVAWSVSSTVWGATTPTTGGRGYAGPALNAQPGQYTAAIVCDFYGMRVGMVRPLKVGVQLPEVEYEYTWPQLAEMAK